MINCGSNPKNLCHREWMEYQFNCRINKIEYRDVILHSSIIESAIIFESKKQHPFPCINEKGRFRTLSNAIDILRRSAKYSQEELDEIDELGKLRNNLIHGIVEKELKQNDIETYIYEMYDMIVKIYESDLINSIFKDKNYGFLPKDKISHLSGKTATEIRDITSDSSFIASDTEEHGQFEVDSGF